MKKLTGLFVGLFLMLSLQAAPKTLLGNVMNKSKCQSCAMALQQLAPFFGMYADNAQGYYPALDNVEGFKALMQLGSFSLQCPGKIRQTPTPQPAADKLTEKDSDYFYIGGMNIQLLQPSVIPFMFDKPGNNHINVLFGDGHVETLNAREGFKSCTEVIQHLHKLKNYDAVTLNFLTTKATAIDKALGYPEKEAKKGKK